MTKKKIGIIGATGYTGSELMRILINHPDVEISFITSESRAGEKFSDVHPFLEGIADQELISLNDIEGTEAELVFLALPHGVSMDFVKRFKDEKFRIIDLSGDFRLDSAQTYEKWYKKQHIFPEGFEDAVFGLPELFRDDIREAGLVANPGCFPTTAILGAAPLLDAGLGDPSLVIVDSKTGVTGAGIKSTPVNLYSNVNDNFKAYGLKKHRHTIEMQGTLDRISKKKSLIQFTPHLLPVDRGILSTIYIKPVRNTSENELRDIYQDYYKKEPFIRMRSQIPTIKDVRGTNYCDLYTTLDDRTNMILIISVIDNLVKGAAGQAVQNMNIMFDMSETRGLNQVPVNP